jgi:ketosteroid isomerase-like protein
LRAASQTKKGRNLPESNLDIVRAGVDAWNRRDSEAAIGFLAPDAELIPMRAVFEGTVYRGAEGFKALLADMSEDWEDFRLETDELREIDDSRVLVLGRIQGRGKASGVEVDAPAAWVCNLRDGKVTKVQFYASEDTALDDLQLD